MLLLNDNTYLPSQVNRWTRCDCDAAMAWNDNREQLVSLALLWHRANTTTSYRRKFHIKRNRINAYPPFLCPLADLFLIRKTLFNHRPHIMVMTSAVCIRVCDAVFSRPVPPPWIMAIPLCCRIACNRPLHVAQWATMAKHSILYYCQRTCFDSGKSNMETSINHWTNKRTNRQANCTSEGKIN